MQVVLGIDAAWTAGQPSGVALVASGNQGWRCVAIAPSYDSFLALAAGTPLQWAQPRFLGSIPNIPDLLSAAQTLAGAPVDVVAVDMPVATIPITGRRTADRAISTTFGGQGCSTHSPSEERPGQIGLRFSTELAAAGFPIATATTERPLSRHLLEVYPHPALLELLQLTYRATYKVAKARRYWPSSTPTERISMLLNVLTSIHEALEAIFGPYDVSLPAAIDVRSAALLKRHEDALDALVCAWVGVCFLQGTATAFGDETAAIWCPKTTHQGTPLRRSV